MVVVQMGGAVRAPLVGKSALEVVEFDGEGLGSLWEYLIGHVGRGKAVRRNVGLDGIGR